MRLLKILYNRIFRREEFEAAITAFHAGREGWDMTLESKAVWYIAQSLGNFFIKSGATNYIAFDMFDKVNMIPLTVIIQRADKLDMKTVNKRLREALEEIVELDVYDLDSAKMARSVASITLDEVGYAK